MSWEDRIEEVAEALADPVRTRDDWRPAVRECWMYGLTEEEAISVCRSSRYPHLIGPVLSVFSAMREPS